MAYRERDPEKISVLIARAERASHRAKRMLREALRRKQRLTVIAYCIGIFLAGWTGILLAWSSEVLATRTNNWPLCDGARADQRAIDEEAANAAAFEAVTLADQNLYQAVLGAADDCERIRSRAVAAEHERVIRMVDECAQEREALRHAMVGRGPFQVRE